MPNAPHSPLILRPLARRLSALLVSGFLAGISCVAPFNTAAEPRPGTARVTIEILGDDGKPATPTFVTTQLQILTKNESLYPVIDRLDLTGKFFEGQDRKPRAEVLRLLKESMVIQQIPNTTLIEIEVSHGNPLLAAQIANETARVYGEQRVEAVRRGVREQLTEMNDELENHRKNAQELASRAAKLRKELNIYDPNPDLAVAVEAGPSQALNYFDQLAAEQSVRVERLRIRRSALERLTPEDLQNALGALQIEDPVFTRSLTSLHETRAEEAKLLGGGVVEKDSRVRAVRAQADALRKLLMDRIEGIRRGQEIGLKIEEETLAAYQARLAATREEKLVSLNGMAAYAEAKTAYLAAKSVLGVVEQRYHTSRLDNSFSLNCVRIWERAEPPVK
jgi:uncharacterized protein involved in exopolysaccharide biosynthesis